MSVLVGSTNINTQLVGANPYIDEVSAALTSSAGSHVLVVAHWHTESSPTIDHCIPYLDGVASTGFTEVVAPLNHPSTPLYCMAWLCSPSAGAHTYKIEAWNSIEKKYVHLQLEVIELTGVDVSTPYGTPVTGYGAGAAASQNVGSMAAGDLAIGIGTIACRYPWDSDASPVITETAGNTLLYGRLYSDTYTGNLRDFFGCVTTIAGTGTVAPSVDLGTGPMWMFAGVRFIAAAAATGAVHSPVSTDGDVGPSLVNGGLVSV